MFLHDELNAEFIFQSFHHQCPRRGASGPDPPVLPDRTRPLVLSGFLLRGEPKTSENGVERLHAYQYPLLLCECD